MAMTPTLRRTHLVSLYALASDDTTPTYTALEKKLEAENAAVGQNKEAIRTLEAKVMELQQDQESESMGKGQAQKDLAQVSATSKAWAWV